MSSNLSEIVENKDNVILETKRRWREHQSLLTRKQNDINFRIGIASTVTIDPLVPFFGSELLEHKFYPSFSLAPYNQIFQACMKWESVFLEANTKHKLDAIVLIWRIDELFEKELLEFCKGSVDSLQRAFGTLDDFLTTLNNLRSDFSGALIVNTPPYPQNLPIHLRDLTNGKAANQFHRLLLSHWQKLIETIEGVTSFDLDGLQREYGVAQARDDRKWYLYRQPYCERFLRLIAQDLTRLLLTHKYPSKKCVVLDCDNTLWGGVLGEDGLEGIQLGGDFPGNAFQDFQKQIINLYEKGVLIALASKNNETDVWQVFDQHDGMILQRKHIAAWRIDWNLKSRNIVEIAKDLNIGIDSMVFIDDSPVETEEMRSRRPEVTCLTVDVDPANLPSLLKDCFLFDRPEVTQEDYSRTEMIQNEAHRRNFQSSISEEEFLSSLEIKVKVFVPKIEHLGRVVQLINKTNQFNITTRRRTLEEIKALTNDPTYRIFALSAKDRFGDYGVVGVSIFKSKNNDWVIDTFLMSCRILGRGIESAFINEAAKQLPVSSESYIWGDFIPTPKNTPAERFFYSHGFVQTNGRWLACVREIIPAPLHISAE